MSNGSDVQEEYDELQSRLDEFEMRLMDLTTALEEPGAAGAIDADDFHFESQGIPPDGDKTDGIHSLAIHLETGLLQLWNFDTFLDQQMLYCDAAGLFRELKAAYALTFETDPELSPALGSENFLTSSHLDLMADGNQIKLSYGYRTLSVQNGRGNVDVLVGPLSTTPFTVPFATNADYASNAGYADTAGTAEYVTNVPAHGHASHNDFSDDSHNGAGGSSIGYVRLDAPATRNNMSGVIGDASGGNSVDAANRTLDGSRGTGIGWTVTNTLETTAPGNGSLVVNGGESIAKDCLIGGVIIDTAGADSVDSNNRTLDGAASASVGWKVTSTLASAAPTNGALVINGGIGIGGAARIVGDVDAGGGVWAVNDVIAISGVVQATAGDIVAVAGNIEATAGIYKCQGEDGMTDTSGDWALVNSSTGAFLNVKIVGGILAVA